MNAMKVPAPTAPGDRTLQAPAVAVPRRAVRERLASLDLGSNSFRLWIAERDDQGRLHEILSHKHAVRLAAGVGRDGQISDEACARALRVLEDCARVLRDQQVGAARAVATSTFRVATNAGKLLQAAEQLLGVPVEIVSGHEEARLIYKGVSRELGNDGLQRLVIDIGGGSTECVIGIDGQARLVDSASVGCVFLSRQYFGEGRVSREAMMAAQYRARDHLAPLVVPYKALGWHRAFGTSGTAESLTQVARTHFGSERLTRPMLTQMMDLLIQAGHVDRLHVEGLTPERRPVLAGGLALMVAAFDEFGIESLVYCPAALRQGALYDLIERRSGQDVQAAAVEMMMRRYSVDAAHAARLTMTAQDLFERLLDVLPGRFIGADPRAGLRALIHAASLAEIGLAVAHEDFNKHGNYILRQADMPGFSRPEQDLIARLTLAQTGSLRGLREQVRDPLEWVLMLCLRWASILHRQRQARLVEMPDLQWVQGRILASWPPHWGQVHELARATLVHEVSEWNGEALAPAIALAFD